MAFRSDWFSRSIPHLERWLTGRRFAHGLEIGSYEGRSACWWLEHCCDLLTCVDPWVNDWYGRGPEMMRDAEKAFDENTQQFGWRISKRKGLSQQVLPSMVKECRFDFAYIDGDHEANSVIMDASMAWLMLISGGVMIFDDYGWEYDGCKNPPKVGIDAFLACFREQIASITISEAQGDVRELPQQVMVIKR